MTEKEYQKEYHAKWYKENKTERVKQIQARRTELRKWIWEYKSSLKCEHCEENDPVCLDFHHRDSTQKDLDVSLAINNGWSKERILKEIEKCMVLCSNHHRKLHYKLKIAQSYNGITAVFETENESSTLS